MKKLTVVALLTLALVFVSTQVIAQSAGLGFSYLNLSMSGERLSSIVTQDVSLALSHTDAFVEYVAQLHQDEVFRQQLRLGPTNLWRGITPFYQLDSLNGSRHSGVGITVGQEAAQGGSFSISGLYREQGYGFGAKRSTERGAITGNIGYSYDKYNDLVVQGPSAAISVRW